MNVLGILGSPKRKGNTARVLAQFIEQGSLNLYCTF